MKKSKVGIVLAVMVCLLVSLCSPTTAFAASKNYDNVTGSTEGTKTFYVTVTPKTYGNDSITLQHTNKRGYCYKNHFEYKLFQRSYGYYKVTVKEGTKTIDTYNWNGKKSLRITFGKFFKYKGEHFNTKVYTIIVKPVSPIKNTAIRKVLPKTFLHWSGSKCHEEPSEKLSDGLLHTPNKWKVISHTSGVKMIKNSK